MAAHNSAAIVAADGHLYFRYENAIMGLMFRGRFSWLIVLGAFMGISALANYWATEYTARQIDV